MDDKEVRNYNIKRITPDMVVIVLSIILLFLVGPFLSDDYRGILSLISMKGLLISCGIVHAHITRKIMFPYIVFAKEGWTSNAVLVIALYIVIIMGWARGG